MRTMTIFLSFDLRPPAFPGPARLLYVGMTRAREKLLLTSSANNAFTERLMALAA